METITVKTQAEYDKIPDEFKGYVYINSPADKRIIIANQKGIVVVAWGNSSVEARGNSSVEAWGNSSVEARENSSVVARGNSSVVARENSSVEARGNVQIAQYSDYATLNIQGNARIVHPPKTIEEYCDFYGVTQKDGCAILYKSIRSNGSSFYTRNFTYSVGETKTCICDPSKDVECSNGMHVSHLHWAIDFGRNSCGTNEHFRVIECAVPIDKIVVPNNTDGKVRTSEMLVLREVPMEEWGVYGKILAKQQQVAS